MKETCSFVTERHTDADVKMDGLSQASEHEQPATSFRLVHLDSYYLRFFSFVTNAWHREVYLREIIEMDTASRWVFLEDGNVFCCGGGYYTDVELKCAFVLGADGSVQRKGDMLDFRKHHGVIALKTAVYVFGGDSFRGLLTSCEKFALGIDVWTLLPEMQYGRCQFNPCVFHGVIYLSGRCVMEVFSPEQDVLLPVQIPLGEFSSCCVYVDKDLLVLLSESYLVKFEAGEHGQLRQLSKKVVPCAEKNQNSQPVVDTTRGLVYRVWVGWCLQVDVDTGVEIHISH